MLLAFPMGSLIICFWQSFLTFMCTTTIKILKTNSLVDFCEAAGELDGEDKELVVDDEED